MKRFIKPYSDRLEESAPVVYPTNFTGMVQGAMANMYTSVMAIAQELANEKAARNPNRYNGSIEEVDISRALNLIFHSDWKKKLRTKALGQLLNKSVERAGKQDTMMDKKNQIAIGKLTKDGGYDVNVNKSSVRFSDERTGGGSGSNQ